MDRLFTPWRLAYVTQASIMTPECIFCDALARIDEDPLVVHRGRRTYVILNKFPYNNGHVMIVPHRHVGRVAELDLDELAEMMALTQSLERTLTNVYRPHGFNILHVVPRWNGDTSFMTVFGDTRVLPEELEATAARLKSALAAAAGA
jgi:ATP adenylyltransferase